ncbi:MAG: hypothetical protein A2V93_03210 [Ignavibacteria bacterium RBG_16_34_14]|nr:MAG: hypothetical protein A2V93_03210 [Ignavibacteria bacterium RBG_16_34_14]
MNKASHKNFPFYGWLGLLIIILFWILNWYLDGLRTHWGFFPLWLGYSVFIDALVFSRKGTSLIKRNWKLFISLFLISMLTWWLFELINLRTQNWFYDGKQYFTDIEYFLLSSLSFSTVMPAVFGTAELAGTFKWIKNISINKKIIPDNKTLLIFFVAGIIILSLIIISPKIFYPFVWISIFLLIEPLNVKLGNKSILKYISAGKWSPIFAFAIGGLICGFFWEMWNYFSYPKWKYYLPGVNVIQIFEMPLPGYVGYLPFPLELFAVYHFISGIFKIKQAQTYIQLS